MECVTSRQMNMNVVKATLQDVGELSLLFDAYRTFYGKPSNIEGATNFLHDRIDNNESVVFLSRSSEGTIAGFVQLYPIFSSVRLKSAWLLNDLFVAQAWRGTGISLTLIEAAKNFSKDTGSCGLLLETDKSNLIANSLYRRTGFSIDEDHNYYFWSE